MIDHEPPFPRRIVAAPELAVIAVLEFSLDTLCNALMAAHPALTATDDLTDLDDTAPDLWCAETIIAQARLLQNGLARYRQLMWRRGCPYNNLRAGGPF